MEFMMWLLCSFLPHLPSAENLSMLAGAADFHFICPSSYFLVFNRRNSHVAARIAARDPAMKTGE